MAKAVSLQSPKTGRGVWDPAFARTTRCIVCPQVRISNSNNVIASASHSGTVRYHQTLNLEIPGSMLRIAAE
jgi:hypothetical protein